MSKCQNIRRRHRKVCIGDLDTLIDLQTRELEEPDFNSPDFDETFTTVSSPWSLVETVQGKNFFDGVDTDTPITHRIYIEFDSTVNAQIWVLLNSRRLRILDTEDLDERGEFLLLICTDRGISANEASKA